MFLGPFPRLHSLALLLASAVALRAVAGWTETLRRPATPLHFDDVLLTGAAWVVLGGAAWTVGLCAAASCEVWSAGRIRALARFPVPARARHGLGVVLGLTLVAAVPAAAAAGPAPLGGPVALPVPDRPTGAVTPPGITVRPGDTLWGLAAGRAGRAVTPAEVVNLVRRLHALNRAVIGPDPDHIEPGQHLAVPRRLNDSAQEQR